MAHKIRVKAVPHQNVNGTLSKTKKDWIVKCKSRGKFCASGKFGTKKDADEFVASHRVSAFNIHRRENPNDIAHRTKHQYSGYETVTPKQVPSRFAPLHMRGLKHAKGVEEWKKRKFKAPEQESA